MMGGGQQLCFKDQSCSVSAGVVLLFWRHVGCRLVPPLLPLKLRAQRLEPAAISQAALQHSFVVSGVGTRCLGVLSCGELLGDTKLVYVHLKHIPDDQRLGQAPLNMHQHGVAH